MIDQGRHIKPKQKMPEQFHPFENIEGDTSCGLLLICDHARNLLPEPYGNLGLDDAEFQRHIAYDIGARDVTCRLAEVLGAPAVLSRFSRLLVDPNRGEDDPTVIMRLSDGSIIPGNHPINQSEIENRLEQFHRPYHAAIDAAIDAAINSGTVPALFSVHSFTPRWRGVERPWHVTLLWDRDDRFARILRRDLSREDRLFVADNEPYDGALKNDTMYRHGTARGLAHVLIEIRQDLIGSTQGAREWAELLAPMLQNAMEQPELHEVVRYGSRTGPVEYRDEADNNHAGARLRA